MFTNNRLLERFKGVIYFQVFALQLNVKVAAVLCLIEKLLLAVTSAANFNFLNAIMYIMKAALK